MTFRSVLFLRDEDSVRAQRAEVPECLRDLNLDQVIDAMATDKREYQLKPFFYTPLRDSEAITYRQEIMRDLEDETLVRSLVAFAEKMRMMRRYQALTEQAHFRYHKEGWFLETVMVYVEAVTGLARDLTATDLTSQGLSAFCVSLMAYTNSNAFCALQAETEKLKNRLSAVRYCVRIKDRRVTVSPYQGEVDYSVEVERTFEKFRQGTVKDYRSELTLPAGMSHVEAQMLTYVAKLHPDVFQALDDYYARNADFLHRAISVFDQEIQFYIAYLDYIRQLKQARVQFCYPQVIRRSKEVYAYEAVDLALAKKAIAGGEPLVPNDFHLTGQERIIVISGPNQGGKTTFARMFGQLHYLACLGCPVPGSRAQLQLSDRIFTHFERREHIENLRGKLQDDLLRIHEIVSRATDDSVIILNEIFTSTTHEDAAFLSKQIMHRIFHIDLFCVWVTFIEELASYSEKTVSMVSTVDSENPTLRTYKILRRPADGLAYAMSIVRKHRLTYDLLKERVKL
ncbi:MAG: MutS-related protein [Anaerolineae bacterium]